jgi:Cu/Ag efflux protein CusF
MRSIHFLAAAVLVAVAPPSNGQGASAPMPMSSKGSSSATPASLPLVNGEVRKLDPSKGLIVLKHEELPSLAMPAMTMGFDVADTRMLKGLKVGDKVRFQAGMVKGKATVTELKPAR